MDREVVKFWRARGRRTNPELGCIWKWCPGVVELERPSVVCTDPRSMYPKVVSECSAVWCPSVGCTDLRVRSVSECREPDL